MNLCNVIIIQVYIVSVTNYSLLIPKTAAWQAIQQKGVHLILLKTIYLAAGLDYFKNHLDTDLKLDDDVRTNSSWSDEDDFLASNQGRKLRNSWSGTFHVRPTEVWMSYIPFLKSRNCHSKSTQVFQHLQPVRDSSVMQDSCSLLKDHIFTARTLIANYC